MKVILKEDVNNIGSAGEVIQVADGYARNYLIPKGFAKFATAENIKLLDHEKHDALSTLP